MLITSVDRLGPVNVLESLAEGWLLESVLQLLNDGKRHSLACVRVLKAVSRVIPPGIPKSSGPLFRSPPEEGSEVPAATVSFLFD